jgi:hypothetical protein
LGGAKLSTKLPLIEVYLKKGCFVYVGGAMVHNIMKAKGYEIGESLYDKDYTVSDYVLHHEKLIIAEDVILDDKSAVAVNAIPKERKVFDCGEKTIAKIKETVQKCHTVIMNGPVGYYEGGFTAGTEGILNAITSGVSLTSIIGGGDTLTVYNNMANKPKLSFISLGGGAMLDFLKDGTLPALEAVVVSHDKQFLLFCSLCFVSTAFASAYDFSDCIQKADDIYTKNEESLSDLHAIAVKTIENERDSSLRNAFTLFKLRSSLNKMQDIRALAKINLEKENLLFKTKIEEQKELHESALKSCVQEKKGGDFTSESEE